jgi:hypothetical protein
VLSSVLRTPSFHTSWETRGCVSTHLSYILTLLSSACRDSPFSIKYSSQHSVWRRYCCNVHILSCHNRTFSTLSTMWCPPGRAMLPTVYRGIWGRTTGSEAMASVWLSDYSLHLPLSSISLWILFAPDWLIFSLFLKSISWEGEMIWLI